MKNHQLNCTATNIAMYLNKPHVPPGTYGNNINLQFGNEKLAAIDVRSFVRRNSKILWREPAVRWSINRFRTFPRG